MTSNMPKYSLVRNPDNYNNVGIIHNPEVVLSSYNDGHRQLTLNDRFNFLRRGYFIRQLENKIESGKKYTVTLTKK